MSAQVEETSAPAQSVASVELKTVGTALVEFDKVAAGIANLKAKYAGVIYPVTTTQGMKDAKAARSAVRDPRLEVEKIRQRAKKPLLEIGRKLDAAAKRITAELAQVEDPIAEQIDNEEARKENERKAAAEIEAKRIAGITTKIDALRNLPLVAVGKSAADIQTMLDEAHSPLAPAEYAEFSGTAADALAKSIRQLETMCVAQEQIETERESLRAEAEELARQRAAQEARDTAEREAIAKLRAEEEARALAERNRIAAAQLAERQAREKAEAEAQAKRDADLAEQQRVLRAERAEQDRVARERQEAFDRQEAQAKERRDAEVAAAQEQLRREREENERVAAENRAVQEDEARQLADERAEFERQQEAARVAALPPAPSVDEGIADILSETPAEPAEGAEFDEVPAAVVGFTRGPWRIGKQGGSVVADYPVPGMNGSDATDYYGGHLIAESITPSNAKLIAAAPDLLEALMMVRDADEDSLRDGLETIPSSARASIDAAIAKATA